jgi:hypothetical protein
VVQAILYHLGGIFSFNSIGCRVNLAFFEPRNFSTNIIASVTADLLQSNSCLVDNLFADLWKQMGMKALLNKAGFIQRISGGS